MSGELGGRLLQFAPPPTDPRLVERSEINDALARDARLWVISAPGGYGKTVALNEWARIHEARVIILKREHSDVRNLAKTVALAISTRIGADRHSEAEIFNQLQWSPFGEESATKLLREVESLGIEPILAFDETNIVVANSEAAKFLDRLVSGCLEFGGRVAISGRSIPKLRVVSRYSTDLTFIELGAAELAFRPTHINEMYRRVFGFESSESLAQAVFEKTRGWGALVALTGKWLAARPPIEREQALREITGNERSIYEYLATEILEDRPEMHRQLLLSISISDRIPAGIVDELLPHAGMEIMRELEFGQFVTRQETPSGIVYEFHPLLADFLSTRAQEDLSSPTLERLHRSFANWFASHEYWHEAFRHWLHVGMQEPIAAQMLAWELAYVEWWPEYGRWLKKLNAELVETMPRLLLRHASSSANLGSTTEAIEWIERASLAAEVLDNEEARIDVKTVKAIVYFFDNRPEDALAICESLEPMIPELSTFQVATLATAFVLIYNNDSINPNRALHFLEIYEETVHRAGYVRGRYIAAANRAVASKIVGDFEGQIGALDRLQSTNPGVSVPLLYQALLTFSSAYALLELGNPDGFSDMESAINLIGKLNARGQIEYGARCMEFHAEDRGVAIDFDFSALTPSTDSPYRDETETYLSLANAARAANLESAVEANNHLEAARNHAHGAHMQGITAIESARIFWQLGNRANGLSEANRALAIATENSMGAVAFRARLFLAANDPASSRAYVAQCLVESRKPFYDQLMMVRERRFVGALLNRALAQGVEPDYAAKLLVEFGETPIRVQTFGGLRVFAGSHEVRPEDWERPQARSVFAFLALQSGRAVHAEEVIEQFWPESEIKPAKANLKTTIARIRKALAPAGDSVAIVIQDELVRLEFSSSSWLDWQAFSDLAERAQLRGGTPEENLSAARACIDQVAGGFLPEYRYDDWAAAERERLGQLEQSVLERLAEAMMELGKFEDALVIGERMMQFDPLDESGARVTILALQGLGRLDEARRARRAFEKNLLDELGLAPSREFERAIP